MAIRIDKIRVRRWALGGINAIVTVGKALSFCSIMEEARYTRQRMIE
jgi:hypothetical protein